MQTLCSQKTAALLCPEGMEPPVPNALARAAGVLRSLCPLRFRSFRRFRFQRLRQRGEQLLPAVPCF